MNGIKYDHKNRKFIISNPSITRQDARQALDNIVPRNNIGIEMVNQPAAGTRVDATPRVSGTVRQTTRTTTRPATQSSSGGSTGRPEYTPRYQGYIDELLGEVQNYDPYISPYADRIDAALAEVENYGPYASPYAQDIADQLSAIRNRDPFSYDLESDPAWQAYRKQYTREGRRASEDAMGQYAAMSGGLPSTAAMAAAQQAGDYYRAQMTDKIPELYRLAYSMYADEGNNMYNQLSALRGLDSDEYGRYTDTYNRMVSDLNALRGMEDDAYGRYIDELNRRRTALADARSMESDEYGRYRDTVGDWERDRDYEDERADAEWERRYKERAYEDDRADAEWERRYKERAYEDDRADADWERAYKERAYADDRADTEYQRNKATEASTVYAYSSSGGEPYTISSDKGLKFIDSAAIGDTMTGGDGSVWRKNYDGSVTITKGGSEWTVAAPATGGGYGGWSGGGDEDQNAVGTMSPFDLRAGMENIIRNGGNSDSAYEDAAAYAYAYAANGAIDYDTALEIVAEVLGNR